MRRFAAIAVAALTGLLLTAAAGADPSDSTSAAVPRPFTATYAVSYRGIGAGELTFKFAHDPATGHYTYETSADPSMLARFFISRAALERSVMEIDAAGVRPLEWKLDDGTASKEKDGELRFDWQRNVATGEIEGKPIELPLEPGTQDRSSIQIAMTTALMRGGEPGTIALIDDNQVKRYVYSRKQTESVDSKVGKVDTILYESTREGGSSRTSRFWIAPSLEYLPVRAEQVRKGKLETVMVLQRLERS